MQSLVANPDDRRRHEKDIVDARRRVRGGQRRRGKMRQRLNRGGGGGRGSDRERVRRRRKVVAKIAGVRRCGDGCGWKSSRAAGLGTRCDVRARHWESRGALEAVVKFELFRPSQARDIPQTRTHRPELIVAGAGAEARRRSSDRGSDTTDRNGFVCEFTVQVHRRNTRKLAAFLRYRIINIIKYWICASTTALTCSSWPLPTCA